MGGSIYFVTQKLHGKYFIWQSSVEVYRAVYLKVLGREEQGLSNLRACRATLQPRANQ
jgi:hypothetical protein